MRRLLLPFVAAFVLVLGLATFAVAQDATPPAEMGEEGNLCPAAIGTPDAIGTPAAMGTPEGMGTPDASPEATELAATPAMDEGSPVASPAGEQECRVNIENFAFVPATIEIEVGTTVTWENHDTAPHTATADDGTFDSDELAQGETFSYTFDQPGEFPYFCEIHPNMTGTVIVR